MSCSSHTTRSGLNVRGLCGSQELYDIPDGCKDCIPKRSIERRSFFFSNRFAKLMKDNFEMLMMGEMKFFLGLQIHQSPRGIFINQSQYIMELLRKHGMEKCDTVTTPMATAKIDADLQGIPTDQSMIGGLMYLTTSRPDIAFATFVCALYQARITEKHLKEVKRIFRYLRQSINKGLWYSKDSRFELIVYSDADLAGYLDEY
ncbi:retrovirus-related pol polyprotein from transposon TNT 1-94, partial [Tanacetum coccineum]